MWLLATSARVGLLQRRSTSLFQKMQKLSGTHCRQNAWVAQFVLRCTCAVSKVPRPLLPSITIRKLYIFLWLHSFQSRLVDKPLLVTPVGDPLCGGTSGSCCSEPPQGNPYRHASWTWESVPDCMLCELSMCTSEHTHTCNTSHRIEKSFPW